MKHFDTQRIILTIMFLLVVMFQSSLAVDSTLLDEQVQTCCENDSNSNDFPCC